MWKNISESDCEYCPSVAGCIFSGVITCYHVMNAVETKRTRFMGSYISQGRFYLKIPADLFLQLPVAIHYLML